jgi:hypothetical protein
MKSDMKKWVSVNLYFFILFFALTSVVQLMVNAINLLSFKVSGYSSKFYSYTSILCLIAAVISLIGFILFLLYFFVKGKKKSQLFFCINITVMAGLLVLSVISSQNIPPFNSYYNDHVSIYDFDLYTKTQGLYMQQLITFVSLTAIQIYHKHAFSKTEEPEPAKSEMAP